jgi:hypothetical protein
MVGIAERTNPCGCERAGLAPSAVTRRIVNFMNLVPAFSRETVNFLNFGRP